ncbi:MAG: 4Fe-4S dicluster domain-containing protein [Caldilineaceae bacterium]|nr:4Fe-4S dicluster domain-containing protein [Caldilineaceae bacterium]
MTTYAFLLDVARCIGCQACVAACKTGNELPFGVQFIEIKEQTRGTFPQLTGGFANHRCYHCADAACVSVCPAGALHKEDGLTRLNASVCTGCGYCVDACPFHVPELFAGRCCKCDGCAEVVHAGGTPWCVKTCPSNALLYGDRESILAEAHARVNAIKERYPKARVYGENEAGGLGVVLVLPDEPEQLDLPANPQQPIAIGAWQQVVQPVTLGLTALGAISMGIGALIARRNHMRELKLFATDIGAKSGNSEPEPAIQED